MARTSLPFPRRQIALITVVVGLAGSGTACTFGDDGDAGSAQPSGAAEDPVGETAGATKSTQSSLVIAAAVGGSYIPAEIEEIVGTTLGEFTNEIRRLGYLDVRVIRRDGTDLDRSSDYEQRRVNVAVQDNIVVEVAGLF